MQIRKIAFTLFFTVLILLMLLHADTSLSYALSALNLWFQKMIPTLFPFILLSGIMIRMNLTEGVSELFYPVTKHLFGISKSGIYCIIMGFLCGFPMGAKVIADLYSKDAVSKQEANYLLSFCNNIGPVYFVGFVLPIIQIHENQGIYLFGMYGLPFLYGIILRHTVYRNKLPLPGLRTPISTHNNQSKEAQIPLLYCIDEVIVSGITSITTLGGYMILFNLFNLIPHVLLSHIPSYLFPSRNTLLAIFNGLMEITSGIIRLGNTMPYFILILLPFGGLSCIAQTYSMIRQTDLSIKTYVLHKILLTLLTAIYYFFFLLQFE